MNNHSPQYSIHSASYYLLPTTYWLLVIGYWLVITGYWLLPASAFAHTDTTSTGDTVTAKPLVIKPVLPSSEKVVEGFQPTKSSLLAVTLSAVVPGAGQIYNEDYWKPPIIWGLGGYWVYELTRNDKLYRDFRDQYQNSITPLTPSGDGSLLRLRNFYRDARDEFAWFLGALYFLNLLDAYVGANLYDFDVSPDLSVDGKIVPRATATLRMRF